MPVYLQLIWLFSLALPIACVAWTITHEEVFREPREFCIKCSKEGKSLFTRKFFYLFTCEYCFSHYVTLAFVALTDFKFLMDDWRGYVIAFFSLVWIANVYMSVFARVRIDLKRERTEVDVLEKKIENETRPDDGSSPADNVFHNDSRAANINRPASERLMIPRQDVATGEKKQVGRPGEGQKV